MTTITKQKEEYPKKGISETFTEQEYLLMVNVFWQFYKANKMNYPDYFKTYLSQCKHYNRLAYLPTLDKWTFIKSATNFGY
jgi:hypothetical protein